MYQEDAAGVLIKFIIQAENLLLTSKMKLFDSIMVLDLIVWDRFVTRRESNWNLYHTLLLSMASLNECRILKAKAVALITEAGCPKFFGAMFSRWQPSIAIVVCRQQLSVFR